jgi:hypothetical protein
MPCKYKLTIILLSTFLYAALSSATGANMQKVVDGPPWMPESEQVADATWPEFGPCNESLATWFTLRPMRLQRSSYHVSKKWGSVLRAQVSLLSEAGEELGVARFVCWDKSGETGGWVGFVPMSSDFEDPVDVF